jgi:tripartite ATP-independent transporter DctP family solute receptor
MKNLKPLLLATLTFIFSISAGLAAQAAPLVIQLGYEENNTGMPLDKGVEKWAELVAEKSKGQIKMEIFPSAQLGSKNDLIDQMLAGAAIITLADGAFFADRGVPDFGIVFGPYIFDTWQENWNLVKSPWYKEQSDKLAKKGLTILAANWIYGDRHLLTKKPVNTVADLKGLKIRVPANTIQVAGIAVLDAAPTPMPLGEVYTALQQGTIDGLEQTLPNFVAGKYFEVAKYAALDSHVKNSTVWLTGTEFFSSLTPEQQAILISAGEEAGLHCNELYAEAEKKAIEELKAAGVTIIEVDREAFKKKAEPFYSLPQFTKIWTPGLYEAVKEAKKQQ